MPQGDRSRTTVPEPLKTYETIFEQEVQQAVRELERPSLGLAMSGVLAGFGIGVSVLLGAIAISLFEGTFPEPVTTVMVANAYTVGFIIVILASTDVFTEYTTIAVLPVLNGRSPVSRLARLWGIILTSNVAGGLAFAALVTVLAPRLGVAEASSFERLAAQLLDHPWWIMLLSAFLAGWLMGFLSWLLIAGRETISQAFFIWIITGTIGFGHLHHCVLGFVEVAAGALASPEIGVADVGRFMIWATAGNIIGALAFALPIHYGALLSGSGEGLRQSD